MNEKVYALLDTVRENAVRAGDTASSVAYLAGKQADALASSAKLNARILRRKGEVDGALRELGRLVYAAHTGESIRGDADVVQEKLQAIDALKAEIADLEMRTGRAAAVRVCPVCGAEIRRAEDAYCRECGEKL